MDNDSVLPIDLPSVCRKKLSMGFDGGQLSSDAGLLLLRDVEKKLGLSRLSGCMKDRRDRDRIQHPVDEMVKLRMFAIAAGYEDADDCDWLRHDPVFKMAVGRLPESGEPLCSQPTMSRLENAPSRIELARMMHGCPGKVSNLGLAAKTANISCAPPKELARGDAETRSVVAHFSSIRALLSCRALQICAGALRAPSDRRLPGLPRRSGRSTVSPRLRASA